MSTFATAQVQPHPKLQKELKLLRHGVLLCLGSAIAGYVFTQGSFFFQVIGFGTATVLGLVGLVRTILMPRGTLFSFVSLFLIAASGISTSVLKTYRGAGLRVDDVAVTDAPNRWLVSSFHFRNGMPHPELKGRAVIRRSSKGGRGYVAGTAYVAPIVPEGWTKDQAVPAWAVYMSTDGNDVRQFNVPHRAGAVVVSLNVSDFEAAVDNAKKMHGITTAKGAPLLHWHADPERLVRANALDLGKVAAAFMLMWGVAFGVWRIFARGARHTGPRER